MQGTPRIHGKVPSPQHPLDCFDWKTYTAQLALEAFVLLIENENKQNAPNVVYIYVGHGKRMISTSFSFGFMVTLLTLTSILTSSESQRSD